jgi:hypothetical protein
MLPIIIRVVCIRGSVSVSISPIVINLAAALAELRRYFIYPCAELSVYCLMKPFVSPVYESRLSALGRDLGVCIELRPAFAINVL